MHSDIELEIFIDRTCPNCEMSIDLANWVRKAFPELSIKVIDLSSRTGKIPEVIFAVPTYLLDGETIFLGNPARQELRTCLEEKLSSPL